MSSKLWLAGARVAEQRIYTSKSHAGDFLPVPSHNWRPCKDFLLYGWADVNEFPRFRMFARVFS
jgi:hypothetical protein